MGAGNCPDRKQEQQCLGESGHSSTLKLVCRGAQVFKLCCQPQSESLLTPRQKRSTGACRKVGPPQCARKRKKFASMRETTSTHAAAATVNTSAAAAEVFHSDGGSIDSSIDSCQPSRSSPVCGSAEVEEIGWRPCRVEGQRTRSEGSTDALNGSAAAPETCALAT